MSDFYTLDYFQAFLGAASIENFLRNTCGDTWYLENAVAAMLQNWWSEGNSPDLAGFIRDKTGHPLNPYQFIENIRMNDESIADIYSF